MQSKIFLVCQGKSQHSRGNDSKRQQKGIKAREMIEIDVRGRQKPPLGSLCRHGFLGLLLIQVLEPKCFKSLCMC